MQTMTFHYSTTDANCPMEGQSDNLFFCSDKRFFLKFPCCIFVFLYIFNLHDRVCFVFIKNSIDYTFPSCTYLISSSFYPFYFTLAVSSKCYMLGDIVFK